jgi:hypothetical protein
MAQIVFLRPGSRNALRNEGAQKDCLLALREAEG